MSISLTQANNINSEEVVSEQRESINISQGVSTGSDATDSIDTFNKSASVNVSPANSFSDMYSPINNYLYKGNPIVLFTLTVVILFYYFVFSSMTQTETSYTPPPRTAGTSALEILMWGMFIFLILINGLQYFFQIDAKTAVKNLFSEKPEVEITVMDDEKIESKPVFKKPNEVFHIGKNIYNYNDAKSLCKAYDSRLATFEEVQKAYNSGAEWCSYGWSEGQYALYPTQKKTWKKLNNGKHKGHEHDCGRPGINGGYIKNKYVKFGVNCFGSKPKIRPEEEANMGEAWPQIPLTKEEKEKNERVEFYKKHIPDIMVAPYNYDKWSSL